ncbi:MAG: DUF1624 domain-containing protein [Clostridia bacterium]|nr:DUF1624 domain-containing protein [Clostridia bacterium]
MKRLDQRVFALDWIRGIAVIGMVLHHALVSVQMAGWMHGKNVQIPFLETELFWVLQEIFVVAFLLISGICTAYSRSVLRRGLIVSGAAMLVTLVTAYLMPALGVDGMQIWFGILHMFGASMLLYGLITCKQRWVGGLTALGLLVLWLVMIHLPASEVAVHLRLAIGFPYAGFYSADYYPLLPYFFGFLAGAVLGPAVRDRKFPRWFYTLRLRPLEWVGRHSLIIYLLHQIVLFGLSYLFFFITA